jgi:hypothetical protein
MKNLKINPALTIKKVLIPNTTLSVYIIDNFLLCTESVVHFAHNIAYFNPMFADKTLFPGMRDKMPIPYTRVLKKTFDERILPELRPNESFDSQFHSSLLSLVSCKPNALTVNQKMPHVDSCNDIDYAFVHYLSSKELGGTSFYCYKPKKLIELKEEHKSVLPEMMTKVKNSPNDHNNYITKSTSLFEQILTVEAKINRLVIYPANVLHSANLISENSYCGDLYQGRLSISSFASIFEK